MCMNSRKDANSTTTHSRLVWQDKNCALVSQPFYLVRQNCCNILHNIVISKSFRIKNVLKLWTSPKGWGLGAQWAMIPKLRIPQLFVVVISKKCQYCKMPVFSPHIEICCLQMDWKLSSTPFWPLKFWDWPSRSKADVIVNCWLRHGINIKLYTIINVSQFLLHKNV